jgi:carbamate kinase
LQDELAAAGLQVPVVSLVTQSIVSANDPAMKHPTKPIGPFYSRAQAEDRQRLLGWEIVEDAARGYRRVVPSPEPVEIVEQAVIRSLMSQGVLVVGCGGGGIPVVRDDAGLHGVEAVIDKDRASALLRPNWASTFLPFRPTPIMPRLQAEPAAAAASLRRNSISRRAFHGKHGSQGESTVIPRAEKE